MKKNILAMKGLKILNMIASALASASHELSEPVELRAGWLISISSLSGPSSPRAINLQALGGIRGK